MGPRATDPKTWQKDSPPGANTLASASGILSDAAWSTIGKSLRLTRREIEIVRSVFNDRKEAAIAKDLGISVHTVHTHVQRLHHKLGVVDRVTLIMRVINELLKLTLSFPAVLPPICGFRNAGKCPLTPTGKHRSLSS